MSQTINIRRDVSDPFYRYKMEKIQSKIEGKGNGIKTVVVNLNSIAQSLSRPPAYVIQPVTVIDWTSPSTRRREYEKIDRSSRGIRGLWRRFAPKWCQPGQGRVPFFEEGKGGKGNYEGSVRRFRMDLPDEEEDEHDRRRVDLGGDGNKDFAISGSRLRNASSKLSGSTYDRGRTKWRCLKLKRRSRSTW